MINPDENEPVDKQIDTYLGGRRKRLLDEAKIAELEHVTEDEKTEAARSRKERQLVEDGKISPIKGEEVKMENTEQRVEDAAEVAAEAARAGVDVEEAKDLGAGKKRVVVIKPESGKEAPTEGGWSVESGKPVKDPEGEYTFAQALKVASLEKAKTNNDSISILKWLKDEGLFGGGKGDEFMSTFMKQLAQQSVDSIVKPPSSGESSSIEGLRTDMKTLKDELRIATDPVQSAKRVKDIYDTFNSLGLIPQPTEGGSLEVTKETHRHDEKMEEIRTERAYKDKLGEVMSELPERIGRGLAGQIIEGEEAGRSSGELQYIICTEEDCGTKIPITPGASQSTCPKCGTVYRPTGTVEAERE